MENTQVEATEGMKVLYELMVASGVEIFWSIDDNGFIITDTEAALNFRRDN